MPRIITEYKEEVRKKIIEAAFSLFLDKGYHGTTMDEIAERLGVTKPALYQYFPSKEDLFAAVAERSRQELMGKPVSIINTGKETAKVVIKTLEKKGMLNDSGKGGCEYFVTDSPDTFKEIGGRFLGEDIHSIKFLKSLDYKDFLLSS